MAAAMLVIDNDDINGEVYIGGQEGEVEVDVRAYHVLFGRDMPCAGNPFEEVVVTAGMAARFITENAAYIVAVDNTITDKVAMHLSFLRMLALRKGLISPNFGIAANFVKYNDAKFTANNMNGAAADHLGGAPFAAQPGGGGDRDPAHFMAIGNTLLTAQERSDMRERFMDIVSCIAIMFRARAHHYTDDIQAKYENLWAKCRYRPEVIDLAGGWKHVATVGLHAIMPIILDRAFLAAAEATQINGALSKRKDVAAAGTAVVRAVMAGFQDLVTVFPALPSRIPGGVGYLNELSAKFNAPTARWLGSVNRKYYGVTDPFVVQEQRLAPIAATIIGIYDTLATGATLVAAPSLKRVANSAPVVKAILGKAAMRASNDERLTLIEEVP